MLQVRQQAANVVQAAKMEEAPAKAAPQVASAKASAPAAQGTAPALTPQDLDRVILMQGEHLEHAGPAIARAQHCWLDRRPRGPAMFDCAVVHCILAVSGLMQLGVIEAVSP